MFQLGTLTRILLAGDAAVSTLVVGFTGLGGCRHSVTAHAGCCCNKLQTSNHPSRARYGEKEKCGKQCEPIRSHSSAPVRDVSGTLRTEGQTFSCSTDVS